MVKREAELTAAARVRRLIRRMRIAVEKSRDQNLSLPHDARKEKTNAYTNNASKIRHIAYATR